MIRTAAIVLGLLLSCTANAQSVRLEHYLHPDSEGMRNLNSVYLAGAIDALLAYNAAAPTKLFCKEGGFVSHDEAAQLIADWAKTQTKMQGQTLVVIPLLLLLKKTYPCP
jgi:hypothetical protein